MDATLDKDEGISDEEDPAELRVLLDLNEQEASQLRRKVEELEASQEASKKQIKELHEKCKTGTTTGKSAALKTVAAAANGNAEKVKLKDKEISELKMKLNEKDRAVEKMKADLKKSGKSGEYSGDVQTSVDHKRQVEMVEQEAAVLRAKVVKLEQEIDSISTENKKLTVQVARLARKDSVGAVDKSGTATVAELARVKETLVKIEKENSELQNKLKSILEVDVQKLPARIPKKFTDLTTKMQLQKMIGELEDEVKDMRAIVVRTGAYDSSQWQEQLDTANMELSKFFNGMAWDASIYVIVFCKISREPKK